jgi:hypothetical protein
MRRRFLHYSVGVAFAVAAAWLVPAIVAAQRGAGPDAAAARNVPTPRTAEGKPDFNGMWVAGGGNREKAEDPGNIKELTRGRPCHPGQIPCAPGVNAERDSGIRQRMSANKPLYRAELWERVQYLDENGNNEDPGSRCYPTGVPRMGAPSKIVQTPTEMIFLYQARNAFRVIPIDGRPHDPINSLDQTWMGDSIGRWEGDTLVVDVVGLTGETWLAWPGYFHSNNMHVVERLTREGNTLRWQATVEDPDVLLKPWVMDPVVRQFNPNPKAFLIEDYPCEERDWANMVTKERG